jgi:RNA polymerase sigma-70 factor (ECF subfamily)
MDDKDIVRLYKERSEVAIEETRAKYGGYLLGVARGILKDERDAEECVNDALLSAWNDVPVTAPSDLKAYLKKLVRNGALSRLRRNNAAKRLPEGGISPIDELEEALGGGNVEETVEAAELAGAISDFLRGRKAEERVMFIKRYRFGEEVASIAGALGVSESKVKMTLRRTRDRLKVQLEKKGFLK